MSQRSFSEATQFTLKGGSITLNQGSAYIAQGAFSDWIKFFEACSQKTFISDAVQIANHITVKHPEHETLWIYDSSQADPLQLKIQSNQISTLESRLEGLHQGCCEPQPFNLVADICQKPDPVLQLLQEVTQYPLTPEQIIIAKESLKTWPTELEITVGDLSQMWQRQSELKFFAKVLKFYFWS